MSNLSITVDTEDKAAIKAVRNMLLSLMCGGDPVPEEEPTDTKPSLKVVPTSPSADDGIEHTYNVDGRDYTAADIQSAGFTVEHLHRSGWPDADIVEVLGVGIDLVEATIKAMDDSGTADEVVQTEASTVALDTKGMPWDPRIHAGTKTTLGSGAWKYKRGVDPAVIEQVEAELILLMQIEPESEATTQTAAPKIIPPPAADQQTAAPKIIPPPQVVKEAGDAEPDMTFAEFLKACSAKMTAGETDMGRILEVVNAKDIPSLQLVNNVPKLIPELWAVISTHEKVAQ